MKFYLKKVLTNFAKIFTHSINWYFSFFIDAKQNSKFIKNLEVEKYKKLMKVEQRNSVYYFLSFKDKRVKKLLYAFKYENAKKAYFILNELLDVFLNDFFTEDLFILNNYYNIITIPPTKYRVSENMYDHMGLLIDKFPNSAQYLKKSDFELDLTKLVKRQSRLSSKSERELNISGAFSIKQNKVIQNQNFIVIDDITTTGATLNEAKKVLKSAGANNIILIAFSG